MFCVCACILGGVVKGLSWGVRAYKNDNASQDGSFYGFSLFLMAFFIGRNIADGKFLNQTVFKFVKDILCSYDYK